MPLAPPPTAARVSPRSYLLRAGTYLWRVHPKDRSGTQFRAVAADRHFGGSRFDGTRDDPYPYLYAALAEETALLESLARGVPFNDRGDRLIRRVAIADLRISRLETTRDLTLVSLLTTADLAAVCQDEWLVRADAAEYPQTRRWAQWLREQSPRAEGLAWQSARDIGRATVVLFGDRCGPGAVREVPGSGIDLDGTDGAEWLNKRLAPYRISVRPPRSTAA